MNLLIVATDFPPCKGGISTYSKELAIALTKTDRIIVLAAGITNKDYTDRCFPYKVIRTPNVALLRIAAFFIYIPWLLWKFHIDAVLHTVWPTALISYIWYQIMPVPYFVSVHASEFLDDKRTWQRRLKSYLKQLKHTALFKASGIFAVSHYSANLIRDLGIEQSYIHVVKPGVNPERFTPKHTNKIVNHQNILLTVGRLDLHKGHDNVLKALSILKERGINPRYIIVGQGDEEKDLRKMVNALNLDSQVTFAGFVPDDKLPELYNACDIFIMASRKIPTRLDIIEGFGISFLEAAACGLPVIAGNSGGVSDALINGKTGILVDPNNPKEIADTIQYLLNDVNLCRRLGSEGRNWVETQMNWERVAKQVREIILKTCKK